MADYAVNIVLKAQDEATATIRRLIAETRKIRSVSGGALGGAGRSGRGAFGFDPSTGMLVPMAPGGRRGRGSRRRPRSGDIGGFFEDWDFDAHGAAAGMGRASANIGRLGDMTRAALGSPLELAMDFEKSIRLVNALSGGSLAASGQLKEIEKVSRSLGKELGVSAKSVADGFGILTQAGLPVEDQLQNIRHVLDFATAGEVEMADAAQYLVDAVGGFNLKFSETARVGNVMARAAMASQIGLGDMGQAFKYAAPAAASLGISVEQTSTAIALLGKAGIKGSMAGTSLRSMFNRLSNPRTDNQKNVLKKLGIDREALRAALDSQDLPKVLQMWADGFARNGIKGGARLAMLQNFFQERGGTGADILIKAIEAPADAAASWETFDGAVNDGTKSLGKMATLAREGAHGDVARMNQAIEDLGITFGNKLWPALKPVIESVSEFAEEASEWVDKNPELVDSLGGTAIAIAGISAVLSPVLLALSSLTSVASLGSFALKKFGGGGRIAAAGLMRFGKVAATTGPKVTDLIGSRAGMVGLLGGVAAAGALGYAFGSWADDTFDISDQLSGLNTELSIHNELQREGLAIQIGLSKVRGAALLGSLTEQEKKDLKAAQAKKEQLSAELAANEDDWGSLALGHDKTLFGLDVGLRGSDAINADIQRQQQIIDRINSAGIAREQRAERQGLEVDPTDMRILRPDEGTQQAELLRAIEALAASAKESSKVELTVRADGAKVTGVKSGSADVSVETGTLMGGA